MSKNIFTLVALVVAIAGCSQQSGETSVAATSKEPPFPSFSLEQLLDLNKNERAELERRCLGVSNPTCDEFKGDPFKKQDAFRKSLCGVGDTVGNMTGLPRESKCDKYH